MSPPRRFVQRRETRRRQAGERPRDRGDGRRPGAREPRGERCLRAFGEEVRGDQERDQEQDEPGVGGQVEPGRTREGAARDRHRDSREDQHLEDVLREGVDVAGGTGQQPELGNQTFHHEGDRAHDKDHEPGEQKDVEDPGVEVAKHPFLQEGVLDRLPDPRADPVEPVFGRGREQDANPPRHRVHERGDGEEDEESEEYGAGNAEDRPFGRQRRHGPTLNE